MDNQRECPCEVLRRAGEILSSAAEVIAIFFGVIFCMIAVLSVVVGIPESADSAFLRGEVYLGGLALMLCGAALIFVAGYKELKLLFLGCKRFLSRFTPRSE